MAGQDTLVDEAAFLNPAAVAALDAVTDDELTEAADLCAQFDIPDEYARQVAAALAVCIAA